MSQNQTRKRPNRPSMVNSKLWRPIQTPCYLDQTENRKKIRKMGKNKWDHVGVGPHALNRKIWKRDLFYFILFLGFQSAFQLQGADSKSNFNFIQFFLFLFLFFNFFFLKKKKSTAVFWVDVFWGGGTVQYWLAWIRSDSWFCDTCTSFASPSFLSYRSSHAPLFYSIGFAWLPFCLTSILF